MSKERERVCWFVRHTLISHIILYMFQQPSAVANRSAIM